MFKTVPQVYRDCVRLIGTNNTHTHTHTHPHPQRDWPLRTLARCSPCRRRFVRLSHLFVCLLCLSDHIAGRSRKGDVMRALVQQQFRMHAGETNEAKVEALKKKSDKTHNNNNINTTQLHR